jgi:hypothetical protein
MLSLNTGDLQKATPLGAVLVTVTLVAASWLGVHVATFRVNVSWV